MLPRYSSLQGIARTSSVHFNGTVVSSYIEIEIMEFRLYNKLNCSVFDLIGNKEPDQTKGLGYLLSASHKAMQLFLSLLFPNEKNEVLCMLKKRWVVDCEMIQKTQKKQSVRADIVILFYDRYMPYKAIVIEAKSVKGHLTNLYATTQVENYRKLFHSLSQFSDEQVTLVTLTTAICLDSRYPHIKTLTWQNLRTVFTECKGDRNTTLQEIQLIKEYAKFINQIQGSMNYYDEEVLTIPAGDTIQYVRNPECAIYECPIRGKYKSRGERHPLYVAFRERGHNGRITDLYKIQDILLFDLDDEDAINVIAAMEQDGCPKYSNIKSRIQYYKTNNPNYSKEIKWVFIIDHENSIHLPYSVEYEGSTRGLAGISFRKLNEFIRQPDDGENVVKLKKKNSTNV